jgi:deoxyribodipyrimidine photolyase
MRELNATGFIHNRVRMIAASFLIKDLHIDWRWGERYFAQNLVDFDRVVNNGNWQWCAPRQDATLSHIFRFSIHGCNRDDTTQTVFT